jgi:hypothetical protein
MINSYNTLIGKAAGNRPFGTLRRRWEDNIKTDLKVGGCNNVG